MTGKPITHTGTQDVVVCGRNDGRAEWSWDGRVHTVEVVHADGRTATHRFRQRVRAEAALRDLARTVCAEPSPDGLTPFARAALKHR